MLFYIDPPKNMNISREIQLLWLQIDLGGSTYFERKSSKKMALFYFFDLVQFVGTLYNN
jgi:hypothetical protein